MLVNHYNIDVSMSFFFSRFFLNMLYLHRSVKVCFDSKLTGILQRGNNLSFSVFNNSSDSRESSDSNDSSQ